MNDPVEIPKGMTIEQLRVLKRVRPWCRLLGLVCVGLASWWLSYVIRADVTPPDWLSVVGVVAWPVGGLAWGLARFSKKHDPAALAKPAVVGDLVVATGDGLVPASGGETRVEGFVVGKGRS